MILFGKKRASLVADKLLGIDVSRTPIINTKRKFFSPYWHVKPADTHNTKRYSFEWMFFKFWTLDHFSFEITFVVSDHWGIGVIGMLPYLRWVITIPMPAIIRAWLDGLSRKPKIQWPPSK